MASVDLKVEFVRAMVFKDQWNFHGDISMSMMDRSTSYGEAFLKAFFEKVTDRLATDWMERFGSKFVEDMTVEGMIKRSFSEFATQRALTANDYPKLLKKGIKKLLP